MEWKWGRVVRAMSIVISGSGSGSGSGSSCWWAWVVGFGRCWVRSSCSRSEANSVIIVRRCSKAAGWGALSAFLVARRRRSRVGEKLGGEERRADLQIWRWARVGGLKDESRM